MAGGGFVATPKDQIRKYNGKITWSASPVLRCFRLAATTTDLVTEPQLCCHSCSSLCEHLSNRLPLEVSSMPDKPLVCRYVVFCAVCGGFGGLLFGAPRFTHISCIPLQKGFATDRNVLQTIASMPATLLRAPTLRSAQCLGLLQAMMWASQAG